MAHDDGKLLHLRLGPIEVDVPQTVGYFGGSGAAVALGLLEPPLAAWVTTRISASRPARAPGAARRRAAG